MATRYSGRKITRNRNKLYKKFFEDRNVNFIRQYRSPDLVYPTPEQIRQLTVVNHVWTTGDRYYKLSFDYYGNVKYWWVIAWFNKKPTEGHLKLGDLILIPTPLDKVLNYFNV